MTRIYLNGMGGVWDDLVDSAKAFMKVNDGITVDEVKQHFSQIEPEVIDVLIAQLQRQGDIKLVG
ncbi:unnamed protein product [marine sediment metagenome]|uniref:Uncharacterized protein n=1 Tax=marine sediment metagenome TaxID=412755 RepID=X1R8K2_9ZZZZ